MLQLEDTIRIHLKQNNQQYFDEDTHIFYKTWFVLFKFLAVFVASNFGAITEDWFNYGVKQFENIIWAKLTKLMLILKDFENSLTSLKSQNVIGLWPDEF